MQKSPVSDIAVEASKLANQFIPWHNSCQTSYANQALQFAKQVEDESISDEQLKECPKKFANLSKMLAEALQKIATGELGRNITRDGPMNYADDLWSIAWGQQCVLTCARRVVV